MSKILQRSHDSALTWHEEDGKVFIQETVDVTGVIDRVQRMRQHGNVGNEVLGQCAASIPLSRLQEWGQQFGLSWDQVANDDALLDRFLADNGKFKVKGGWQ